MEAIMVDNQAVGLMYQVPSLVFEIMYLARIYEILAIFLLGF